jgi:magnesium and cobalt transporter
MSDGDPSKRSLRSRWRNLVAPKNRRQLRETLKGAETRALIDTDALSMLEGVLDVADLQVRDIMVPHNHMISVSSDDAAQRILSVAIESGHSRFPVLDAETDRIVGILLAKDLLRLYTQNSTSNFNIRDWMRKPVFVPESKRVNVLLKELRIGRNHMAIAVDEYGGVAGLVTIEDVIEQIVGEIDDEHDVDDQNDIRREGERQYLVLGTTRIDDFNEYFNVQFSDDAIDTVAGLVTQHFGRLPRRGEHAVLDGFEFRVMRADRRRIEVLRVTVPDVSKPAGDSVAAMEESG